MNDEDRILEDIKEILKELDEQGRMKYTQRYMQHSDISVYKHCISVAYTSVELVERFSLNVNELTRREENIISRHMFPLNIVPPMCKEAWLVCLADKICASKETIVRRIHIRRYKK